MPHFPRLLSKWWTLCATGAALALSARSARAQNVPQWNHALDFAGQQLQRTASHLVPALSPTWTNPNGSWNTDTNTDQIGWTQGFFPGSSWYLFENAGASAWSDLAMEWTTPLQGQEYNTATHDLGFKMFPSFGHGYELTKNETFRQIALTAAGSLATRFHPVPGVISMGDWIPSMKLPIVIDTMMDIELLVWAARNGGNPVWEIMAVSHAKVAMQDLLRGDGSTYQAANFDPTTGQLLWLGTLQGYSNTSTWARGQAWAIYGFARLYGYTGNSDFLDASRRATDLFLSRLPADSVPPWDFDAPDQTKDSSAAAAAAAGMLQLANVETNAENAARYRSAAMTILDVLSGSGYLAAGTSSAGVLLHGVGNYPAHQGINASLTYGDYYFVEAILRAEAQLAGTVLVTDVGAQPWPDAGTPAEDAGPPAGDGGVVTEIPDASEPEVSDAGPDAGPSDELDGGATETQTSGTRTPADARAGGCNASGPADASLLYAVVGARVRRRRRARRLV
jgi:unsaturated chondroitin disaccharide hydrolase